jgi:hypothetical protein
MSDHFASLTLPTPAQLVAIDAYSIECIYPAVIACMICTNLIGPETSLRAKTNSRNVVGCHHGSVTVTREPCDRTMTAGVTFPHESVNILTCLSCPDDMTSHRWTLGHHRRAITHPRSTGSSTLLACRKSPNFKIIYLWISIIGRYIQNMSNSHSVFEMNSRYVAHSEN